MRATRPRAWGGPRKSRVDLEALLTRPEGFGLEKATPVQRALCRVIGDKPLGDLATHPDVLQAFGGQVPPEGHIREIVVLAAIRSGKTLIASCVAVWVTQTADLDDIRPGEIPRFTIMSTARDQAEACLDHIRGSVQSSPVMRRWLAEEPKGDSVLMRHPSGKLCEIKVVAGSRAGSTLVARWSIGGVFDEAPRMVGSGDGVVNLEDARSAIVARVRKGCPLLYIGSPWAPFGPVYDWTQEGFGQPTKLRAIMRAPGPLMNPSYFTPEKCEEIREQDATAYKTDVLGEFADADEAFFPLSMIQEAIGDRGPLPIPRKERHHYVAAMDPATRTNAWTFAVSTVEPDGLMKRHVLVLSKQWTGKIRDRARPKAILEEIAAICSEYGVDDVHTDQYSAEALQDLADDVGLSLIVHDITRAKKHEQVANLRSLMEEGRISLPADADIRKDLQLTRRKVTQDGVSVVYPRSSDGRHCDHVPTIALCVAHPPDPPDPEPTELELMAERRAKLRERAEKGVWDSIEDRVMGRF
jgi:hypothetical protein